MYVSILRALSVSLKLVPGARQDAEARRSNRRRRLAFSVLELEQRQLLSTFTVTNTADSGTGSFRQAIISADAASGGATIDFSIGTGAQTITPASALPSLTGNVTINATTQPGYAGKPLITLNGTSAGGGTEGISLAGNSNSVLGLVIDDFGDCGILINGNDNIVSGNYIGLSQSGTTGAGNGGCGVEVSSGSYNIIGGTTATARNVISDNGSNDAYEDRGVLLNGVAHNTVEGNYFGVNAAGTAALSNYGDDVCLVGASDNTIGGTATGAGNLISGSGRVGIWVDGYTASGNVIQGNLIGTDVTGTKPIGDEITGIMLEGAPNNTIGGTTAAARNVISANVEDGVMLDSSRRVQRRCRGQLHWHDRSRHRRAGQHRQRYRRHRRRRRHDRRDDRRRG